MLYTNWDDRYDPDYDPTLYKDEEDYPDEQTMLLMTMQVFVEEIIDILKEIDTAIKHQIDRNQLLE